MARFDFRAVADSWKLFTPTEKRNIAIYILGIMLYKFGLEAFNGSFITLATNRYDWEAARAGRTPNTFERVGLLTGLNQAFQCVGSILIAPLIKRWPTKLVLSTAILVFGVLTAVVMIVDASTGGTFKPSGFRPVNETDFSYFGDYNTDGLIPLYCVTGIAYGMVELIRRVIPRDIVGGNVQKLRRMDAMVHIFYEVSGTAGAFCTALALIPRFGNNFSFIITPIFFAAAAITWFFVSNLGFTRETKLERSNSNYFVSVLMGFGFFFESIYVGAKIIFTSRKFIWLVPGYSLALYGHRYLENGIAPAIARRYLGTAAWSQIMVGGSNLGELLGAGFVFLFTNFIQTPMPWLRLDALTLLIVWYLPYWRPTRGNVNEAWKVAGTFIPISFGWAAGDVSLAAYIQASLARVEGDYRNVSPLGAVMAFLYSFYVVLYAIMSPVLGRYIDRVFASTNRTNIFPALVNIAGVQFTVLSAIVIASTFIPRGALSLNPPMLNDEALDFDIERKESQTDSEFEKVKRQSVIDDRRNSVTRVQNSFVDVYEGDVKAVENNSGLVTSRA